MKIYTEMYKADRVFMARLKALDKKLDCKYRYDLGKFVITWWMPYGEPAELFVVNDKDSGFRHPDRRDIDMLCEGDIHATNLREKLDKTEKYMSDYRAKQEANRVDEIKHATKGSRIQLMNAYRDVFNTGGKKAEHRRIIHKHKGQTIDELQKCVAR